jgi:hypothetical protein
MQPEIGPIPGRLKGRGDEKTSQSGRMEAIEKHFLQERLVKDYTTLVAKSKENREQLTKGKKVYHCIWGNHYNIAKLYSSGSKTFGFSLQCRPGLPRSTPVEDPQEPWRVC